MKVDSDRSQAAWAFRMDSLVELLRARCAAAPESPLYCFVDYARDEMRSESVSVGELDARARALAAVLQASALPGDRALILAAPGAPYVVAFFACLYAGVVAVPAYLAPVSHLARRVRGVLLDCTPALVLADAQGIGSRDAICAEAPGLASCRWVAVERQGVGLEHLWKEHSPRAEDVAYLQYTSGSTGNPRGVIISHANVLSNLASLEEHTARGPGDRLVTWLPPYHDMGLVGHLLSPLYSGYHATVMSPFAFAQEPSRWLREATRQRATYIGAPNFAYELCVKKVSERERAELDLSSVELALCAAEPIRAVTLERFADRFGGCGFRREAFFTGYGLAEATLMVSAAQGYGPPPVLALAREGLAHGRVVDAASAHEAVRLVGSGKVSRSHEVLIVDPHSRRPCGADEIGEVWVRGASVAQGYWRRPDPSRETFQAELAGDARDGKTFLRTGDLGFLREGELYICGRIKDLLVVHGANHYPQDIEASVDACHPALRTGCGAAFAVEVGGEERLVIAQELRSGTANLEQVYQRICRSVRADHGLPVHAVALIEPGGLPKSTSGKIARQPAKRAFLEQSLPVIRQWIAPAPARGNPGEPAPRAGA